MAGMLLACGDKNKQEAALPWSSPCRAREGDLDNVMVFGSSGTQVDSLLSGPLNSGVIVSLMGLTGDSRRMVTTNVQVGDPVPLISINFTNLPWLP